jgi:TP901 family phage tail tape measure protein
MAERSVIQLIITGKDLSKGELAGVHANLDKMGKKLQTVGKQAMIAGLAIGAGLGFAVKGAASVEAGIHNALTLVDATEKEFGAMKASMTKLADDLSVELGQSAKDISVGFYQTLSAGAQAMTPGFESLTTIALKMAKTVGLDTAESVELLADSVNAFKFTLEETERVADVFFTTSKLVATTVVQLREAMRTAAPTAAAMNVDIETTATLLAAMAAQGVKASEAGVGFRQVMLKLGAPTAEARNTLADLKVSLFEANGQMRDMLTVIDELQMATVEMSDKQRAMTFEALVGARAFTKLGIIVGTNAEKMRGWRDRLEETGSLQKAFITRMSSLSGQFEIFLQKLQRVRNELGRALLPMVKDLLDLLAPLAMSMARFASENATLVQYLALLSATLVGGGGLLFALGTLIRLLPLAGAGLAALMTPAGLTVAALTALPAVILGIGKAIKELGPIIDGVNRKRINMNIEPVDVEKLAFGDQLRQNIAAAEAAMRAFNTAMKDEELVYRVIDIENLAQRFRHLAMTNPAAAMRALKNEFAGFREESARAAETVQRNMLPAVEAMKDLVKELRGERFAVFTEEEREIFEEYLDMFPQLADHLDDAARKAFTLKENVVDLADGYIDLGDAHKSLMAAWTDVDLGKGALEMPVKLKTDWESAQEVKAAYERWFQENPIEVPPLKGGGLSRDEMAAVQKYTNAWVGAIDSGLQLILQKTAKFRDVFTAIWKSLASAVIHEISRMIARWIVAQTVVTLLSFIGPTPAIPAQTGGKVISGFVGRDTVPMALGKGEQILDHGTTERLEAYLDSREFDDYGRGPVVVMQSQYSTASSYETHRTVRNLERAMAERGANSFSRSRLNTKGVWRG